MRKLIFREVTGVYGLCEKDRQDIAYHILNDCNRMVGNNTSRHNLIVDRLKEAIKIKCHIIGDVYENTK
jgi:hypothetical protein